MITLEFENRKRLEMVIKSLIDLKCVFTIDPIRLEITIQPPFNDMVHEMVIELCTKYPSKVERV